MQTLTLKQTVKTRALSKLLFSVAQVNGCVRVTSLQPPSQGQHLHQPREHEFPNPKFRIPNELTELTQGPLQGRAQRPRATPAPNHQDLEDIPLGTV